MTVKKMSKILTFILVLAMMLGTVAMATEPSYTVSATDGSLVILPAFWPARRA